MYLRKPWIHKVLVVVLAMAGSLVVGCAIQLSLDLGEPCCAAERLALRGAQDYYTKSVLVGAAMGAAVGVVAGALTGTLSGESAGKGALIGGAGGAVLGAIGGYYRAKQQVTADAAALSDSILKDAQTENGEIDKARLAFAKLRNCHFTAAQQVKSEFAAGRITRAQAISRLDELKARFNQDLVIADEIGAKMADRSREFGYASDQLVAAEPEAKSYLASYPITPVESGAAPTKRKTTKPKATPAPKAPPPKATAKAPKPPAKAPPPKAAPVVAVAQEINTNQIKQKEYTNEVAVSKSEERRIAEIVQEEEQSARDNIPSQDFHYFPWPLPLASATEVIPRELLQEKSKPMRLIDVDHKLTEAIKKNGYYESSYYDVPAGFALVTRIEQIEPDGTPKKEPQRWTLKNQSMDEFSLAAYLKALLFASPGYYRVIVFIVIPVPLTQSSSAPTLEETEKWLSSGYNRLPDAIGNLEFSQAYTCTALIYEFERESESDEPRFRQPGRIPGHNHLVKAGIWASLQR